MGSGSLQIPLLSLLVGWAFFVARAIGLPAHISIIQHYGKGVSGVIMREAQQRSMQQRKRQAMTPGMQRTGHATAQQSGFLERHAQWVLPFPAVAFIVVMMVFPILYTVKN
ncbi:MAG TPA: hypothetical protein VF510_26035, partial [Ktedonobacterales bacterium]